MRDVAMIVYLSVQRTKPIIHTQICTAHFRTDAEVIKVILRLTTTKKYVVNLAPLPLSPGYKKLTSNNCYPLDFPPGSTTFLI